jgi:hypothetical protein
VSDALDDRHVASRANGALDDVAQQPRHLLHEQNPDPLQRLAPGTGARSVGEKRVV